MITEIDHSKISLGQLNVQGLGSKEQGKYRDLLNEIDIQILDVLCITESHLKKEDQVKLTDLWKEKDGSLFRCDREGMRGGGVILAISNKYHHRRLNMPKCEIEFIVAEIFCPVRTFVVNVYISPHHNKALALDELRRVLSKLEDCGTACVVIMGDFNEDLLNNKMNSLYDYLIESGFIQHMSLATTDYGSLLEHIYTKNIDGVEVDVQDCYFSDHDKTFCFF